MTAIAYRFPFIVADQRITTGTNILGSDEKIVARLTDDYGLYIAMAGDCGLESEVVEYIFNDLVLKEQTEVSVKIKEKLTSITDGKGPRVPTLAVLFDKKNKGVEVYCYDDQLYRVKARAPFHAEGCAYRLCLGAMATGASAWEAVDIAVQWDVHCGYPIDGYNVTTGQYFIYESAEELKQHHGLPRKPVQHDLLDELCGPAAYHRNHLADLRKAPSPMAVVDDGF